MLFTRKDRDFPFQCYELLVLPEVKNSCRIFFAIQSGTVKHLPKEIVVGVAIDIDSRKRLGVLCGEV